MNDTSQRKLEDLLDRQIETGRRLASTLAEERAALTGDQPDTVHQLADAKVRLFREMEALEAERRSLWDMPDNDTARLPASLAERWRVLLELMAAARKANEVNGHVIHIRQNQIHQLIDIVRGGAPMTYGRQGKTYATALRALARA